jgi:hypothetical protein
MNKKFNISIFTILMVGVLMAGVAAASTIPEDQPDATAYVGMDWNCFLPAFKGTNGLSIPFKPQSLRPPIGYKGDFYIDEFTDAKIKQAWQEIKAKDPEMVKKVMAGLWPTNTDATQPKRYRVIGALELNGAVNGNDPLKLIDIRRPKFFGQAPYFETIAKVEQNTYTVEFTVPRDPYERLQLKLTTPVKLRGWFIKGKGVPDAKGKKIHALVIYYNGLGSQILATQHPNAPIKIYNVQTKRYEYVSYPNKKFQSEKYGGRNFRQDLYSLNQAGFDVLTVDKRGHGVSGGVNANNAAEDAEDVFRMLDQLESGDGLTILTPTGQLLHRKQTVGLLLRGKSAKQVPIIIGGSSRGSQITCYAMQKNFVGWTAYNEPGQKYSPAKKYNIKAALLLLDFAGGLGYITTPDLYDVYKEAAVRVERYSMVRPTSEILANINQWPAVFFGKGLWDPYQSAEGTYEVYRRANGLKELIFIRGTHSSSTWGTKNLNYIREKMTDFAVRSVVNPGKKYPELKSLKEAVLSSAPYWEPTSRP